MSNKIDLDKYYTPLDKAKYCIEKAYQIIGENNISEAIEPSAGNGSFSLQVPTTCWGFIVIRSRVASSKVQCNLIVLRS